jgi:hypothetical protein
MFPKALGVALVAATVCYLVDVLVAFLVPDLGKQIHAFVVIVPAIAEISMVAYLLVKGARSRARPVSRPSPARRCRRGDLIGFWYGSPTLWIAITRANGPMSAAAVEARILDQAA